MIENLYDKRRVLRAQTTENSRHELAKVEAELAEKYSENIIQKNKEEV